MATAQTKTEPLCLACGVCCNGVLFGDVVLQPGDKPARMRAWGISIAPRRGKFRFPQPCAAFGGDHCRIYEGRPRYCRDFECGLLRAVHARQLKPAVALRWIRAVHRRADRVKRLLRQLGDDDERVSLRRRFQRMAKRCHAGAPHHQTADLFSRLTLAMHELNLILRNRFYPGTARS
jgi:Fe-S-cluster containining protein